MKKLVLLSLVIVGSSYAMDPEKETDKFPHTKGKSSEIEVVTPRRTPEPTVTHSKFCMENPLAYSQVCCCIVATAKRELLRCLTRSRE
jgi:hypothetical protein